MQSQNTDHVDAERAELWRRCRDLAASLDTQKAISAELRVDAERYRKVRRGQRWSVINGVGDELRGDALDAAVDAVPTVGGA